MRHKIIIGNWKMNKDANETKKFLEAFNEMHFQTKENLIYGIAFPYVNLAIAAVLKKSEMQICSQNISSFESGAHTGEISAKMLKAYEVSYTIIGHSERRQYNNESSDLVNQKAKIALNNDIVPIICVGENLDDFENNLSKDVVKKQVLESTKDLDLTKIIIAYEPIWAIGTGKTATTVYAQEMCNFIRSITSNETLIQYGGSVTSNNIRELLEQPDIDGALVGGASLDVDSFVKLISA